MQAVVKTPRIEIRITGDIPKKILSVLCDEYGKDVQLSRNDDEEMIDVFESGWFRKIKAETTAGENVKIYRELHGMTQKKLGDLLGGTPRQHISNMEKGTRAISLKTAQKLAKIFEVSVEKFI